MIKEFLQFIKKTILAVSLSQNGLYMLMSGLKTFNRAKIPAYVFQRNKTTLLKQNLDSYFAQNKDSTTTEIIKFLLTTAPLYDLPLYYKPASESKKYQKGEEIRLDSEEMDLSFVDGLLKEMIEKDFAKNYQIYKTWQKTMDSRQDMRLYGALLEEVNQSSKIYEIDWIRSDKKHLRIKFKQKAKEDSVLPKSQQKKLAEKFGELMFIRGILLEGWDNILFSTEDDIGFLHISGISRLSLSDLNFAIEYIQQATKAETNFQSKIIYALERLRCYCPSIDIREIFNLYLYPRKEGKGKGEQTLFNSLAKHGMVYLKKKTIALPQARSLTYLLDSQRHKKDNRYKKSASLYVALLLLIYILYRYF